MRPLYLVAMLILSQKSLAFGPPAISANRDGLNHYKSEDYSGAFNDFAKALGKDAHNPIYHFNLGDTFLKNGDTAKAISEFDAIEKNPQAPQDLKYKSMFNAGNAALQAKDIAKAMNYYQRALEYQPNSKEVKTNMELALQNQQGGGGKDDKKDDKNSDKKDDKDKKDKKDDKPDDKQQQKPDDSKEGQKEKPKPFESKALNENDVRRILEELKRQEEQIRAKQNFSDKKTPEQNIEKDW